MPMKMITAFLPPLFFLFLLPLLYLFLRLTNKYGTECHNRSPSYFFFFSPFSFFPALPLFYKGEQYVKTNNECRPPLLSFFFFPLLLIFFVATFQTFTTIPMKREPPPPVSPSSFLSPPPPLAAKLILKKKEQRPSCYRNSFSSFSPFFFFFFFFSAVLYSMESVSASGWNVFSLLLPPFPSCPALFSNPWQKTLTPAPPPLSILFSLSISSDRIIYGK